MSGGARWMAIVAAAALFACGKKDEGGGGEETAAKTSGDNPAAAAEPVTPQAAAEIAPEPAAGSSAPTSEEQATADKAAAALEELGKIAEGAKGNCDKAATAMRAVIDKNKAVLASAEKLGQDPGKEQWLADKYGPRTDAAKSKLMPLMEKCAEHEGIATVFDSIE